MNFNYQISEQWLLGIKSTHQYWETDFGTDRLYTSDGEVLKTRLNEVTWESISFDIVIAYRF